MSRAETTTKPPAAGSGAVMTQRQILFVIIGLMAGMFLGALDQTVVGTSIRTIADDLHGLDQQAWVTTAYLIMSTIATPIYGKLSDIFGRRPLFIFAISVFAIGSLAASFSTSMYELAAFRALQGLGAGGLMSLPLTIMGDMLAPRERAKYQGYFLAVFGISSVIGPLVGGLFAGAPEILFITGWRWVFLINVPISAIALIIVLRFLHLPKGAKRNVRIDWWGATAVIVALVPLLLVAENGRDWGWGSAGAWACYIVGVIGVVAFIFIERAMKDDALIPLKLFKSSTFSMATILGVLVGFGMFGALLTIPLYLQLVAGSTPTQSGLQLLPMILGLMISSIASGQIIARTGKYRMFPIIGTGLMTAGFVWFTFLRYDSSIIFVMFGMLLVGLGLGQLMQTLTIASQNSVGIRDMGVATAGSTFFRQIGGTLGTAVLFSVLFTRIPDTISAALGKTSVLTNALNAALDPAVADEPKNKQIMSMIYDKIVDPIKAQLPPGVDLSNAAARHQVVEQAVPKFQDAINSGSANVGAASNSLNGDTSFLNNASQALKAPFLIGFSNATVTVFWVAVGVVLLAFILSWFLKTPPLRAKSALQEAADDQNAANAAAAAAADAQLANEARTAADEAGVLIETGVDTSSGTIPKVSGGGAPAPGAAPAQDK